MKNKSGYKNIKNKITSVVLYVLLVVISILMAISIMFQSPVVQTITAKFATEILSKSLGQSIKISTIKLGFFSGISIADFDVKDHHNNTLLYVGKLSAIPVFSNFSFSAISFVDVKLDSVLFNMGTYKGDSTNNLSYLLNKFSKGGSGSTFSLFSTSVNIISSKFVLFNQNKVFNNGDNSMDYSNIAIDSINIDISNFVLIGDSLNFRANSLTAHEKSGVSIKKMSSDVIISSRGIYTNNLFLDFNNSHINADFGLEYSSYSTFGYYIDSVNMVANIRPTTIDMADIGYFAEILHRMPNIIGITGKMTGTVSDLVGNDLKVKFGTNTRFSGDIRMTGLPDFYTTHMIGNKLKFYTNTQDIASFRLPIDDKSLDFTSIMSPDEHISVAGNFDGYFKDFTSKLDLSMSFGIIKSDIKFEQSSNGNTDFDLSVIGDSVNIGAFLNKSDILGNASFNLKLSGNGKSANSIAYNLKGTLTDADLLDYNYRRISIDGRYNNDSVIADLRVGDKNLMMNASATAHLINIPIFTLNSTIVSANLNKLNLWSDQNINLSSRLVAKVAGTDISTLQADISLIQNNLVFDDNTYIIDSITLVKKTDSSGTKIKLNSDIAVANIKGKYNILSLAQSTFVLANSYFKIMPNIDADLADSCADIDVVILKPQIISNEFLSGVNFAKDTKFNSKLNFIEKTVQLTASSYSVNVKDSRLDSCVVNVTGIGDSLICNLGIESIILKDSTNGDTLVFGMDDFSLSAKIESDTITYGINWDNRNQTLKNSGNIEGYLSHKTDTTKFSIGKAIVYINDIPCSIDTNNLIVMQNNRVYFHDVFINAGNSEFKLLGTIPKKENDSLVAKFTNWDISTFDIVTNPMNISLGGLINGKLIYSVINSNPALVSNISIKDLTLNNEYLGDAHLLNTWDNTNNSVFIKTHIIRQGNAGSGEVFLADGYYYPFKKLDNLNIDISFNRIKLKIIEPFVGAFVKDIEGTTSGKIAVRGSALKPIITGSADLQRTAMRVVYLNTKYSFSNSIEFFKNGINFDNLVIYDTLGNKADINGSLTHNYFKNPQFNVDISTSGLLFFNTTEHMNDLYFGSAIASGNIKISGSPSDIDLNINIKTKKGTSVTLPLNYSVEVADKDYIIFVKPLRDSIAENNITKEIKIGNKKKLSYNIEVGMDVTPEAQVTISLPDEMGTIEASGSSNLALDVNSDGKFSLVGDYTIDDGLFHFKLGNLVSKRFILVKGGRISWTGSPYSANVNIKGLYKVKTSLASLGVVIDSSVSYKNNVTVECYVVLTNELLNPTIKFEIQIPELDPDLQRQVFSELDTTNTAMMNQQMISLLVLGTFNFNNTANVSLQSSYYNVIANQLSSMLSQISDNVNVGLNYKPGDDVSEEEFEVALSTQLFNDRLTIDGNFGMTYDRSEQSASNIVGDINIGYKLTPDGQWILKVFNHSNVNSWYNYNNYDQISPYTQGVGIAFVKNFNRLSDLFKRRNKNKENSKTVDKSNKETKENDTN